MIMVKHNQHHQITFSIYLSGYYNSRITSKVNNLRVKRPTKTHTDLYNGDLKISVFFFSDSACYHQVSSMMAIKKKEFLIHL